MPYTVREPAQGVVNYTVQGPGGQWNWLDGSGWFQNGTFKVTYPTTSAQLTLEYDNADNFQVNVSSAGAVTYTAAGSAPSHTFSGGVLTFNGAATFTGNGTFSAGTDASTTLTVGQGGAAPTAARTVQIALNVPDSSSFHGNANILYQRNSGASSVAGNWVVGLTNDGPTGAKTALNDFIGYTGGSYVWGFTAAGALTTASGITVQAGGLTVTGNGTFSVGADANTSLTVGQGGAAPMANREAAVVLNAPSSGSFIGVADINFQRAGSQVWDVGINQIASSGAKSANTDFYFFNGTSYVAALSQAGALTTASGITVQAGGLTVTGNGSFSSGTDINTSLSVGSGGTPTANRSAPLVLNVPSSGSFPGTAETRYQRNGANVWTTGVDTSSGNTHLLNTDLYFNSFLSGAASYVATISGTGGFTTLNGITTLNGNIQAAGNVVATAGSLFSGADPTGVTGQFAIGATATVGNGGTASLIAATKNTGGGPASMTVLTWVHAAIGSSPCWIPLFA